MTTIKMKRMTFNLNAIRFFDSSALKIILYRLHGMRIFYTIASAQNIDIKYNDKLLIE